MGWERSRLASLRPDRPGRKVPPWLTGTLGLFQLLSAGTVAIVSVVPSLSWIVWVSLLPFFLAITLLRPLVAAAQGLLWGLGYFIALILFVKSYSWTGLLLLGSLSMVIPAIYALVASSVVRRAGFNPMFMGFSWIGLELLLRPLAMPWGLLGAPPSSDGLVMQVGSALGYVFVAFLIAGVNALLVRILLSEQLRTAPPRRKSSAGGTNQWVVTASQLLKPARVPARRNSRAPPASPDYMM